MIFHKKWTQRLEIYRTYMEKYDEIEFSSENLKIACDISHFVCDHTVCNPIANLPELRMLLQKLMVFI